MSEAGQAFFDVLFVGGLLYLWGLYRFRRRGNDDGLSVALQAGGMGLIVLTFVAILMVEAAT